MPSAIPQGESLPLGVRSCNPTGPRPVAQLGCRSRHSQRCPTRSHHIWKLLPCALLLCSQLRSGSPGWRSPGLHPLEAAQVLAAGSPWAGLDCLQAGQSACARLSQRKKTQASSCCQKVALRNGTVPRSQPRLDRITTLRTRSSRQIYSFRRSTWPSYCVHLVESQT